MYCQLGTFQLPEFFCIKQKRPADTKLRCYLPLQAVGIFLLQGILGSLQHNISAKQLQILSRARCTVQHYYDYCIEIIRYHIESCRACNTLLSVWI